MNIRDYALAAAGMGVFILCITASVCLSDLRDDGHAARLAVTDPAHGLVATAHDDLTQTRAAVLSEVDLKLSAVIGAVADPDTGLIARTDRRAGEALEIARAAAVDIGAQLNSQLTALNNTAGLLAKSTSQLEDRYRTLPDEMRADREYQGLVAETMGVLGATKVTMGQAAKTARVIADEAPKMTAHIDSVAGSVEREADELTKPKSFWASLRTWLLAVARIYGAL